MTTKIRDRSAWTDQSEFADSREGASIKESLQRLSLRWAAAPLLVLDAACIALSMLVAYHFRFRMLDYGAPLSGGFYLHLAIIGIPMWLALFSLYRLYDSDHLFGGTGEYARVLNACTTGLVALIMYSFLTRRTEYEISRGWLASVWFLSVLSVTSTRFAYRRVIYRLRENGLLTRRVLIVGANEEGRALHEQLRTWPRSGVNVVGFAHPGRPETDDVGSLPLLTDLGKLAAWIERLRIEELLVVPTALHRTELLDLYRDWGVDERVRIRLSSGLYELFTTGIQVSRVGFVPLVSLDRTRIKGVDALMKAALDYAGALFGIVVLSPLLVIISTLVRMTSPGPTLHRRRVIGMQGREFCAYKFRTMVHDADAYLESHPDLKQEWDRNGKIQDDPRITPLGHVLRSYSLDELPQLFNVLKGEMSLVGPRMITPEELSHFGRWRHNLLTVKPGLTGLWQVSGRADVGYEERVHLDMTYIRNYTIWLDLKLLFSTLRAVVSRRGAY